MRRYERIVAVDAILPDGLHRGVFNGQGYLISMVEGEIFVAEDRCPHADFPLSSARREADCVICPMHNGIFNLRTGESVGSRRFNPLCRVPSRVIEGYIEIEVDAPGERVLPGENAEAAANSIQR